MSGRVLLLALIPLVLASAACGLVVPGSERLHQQAEAALARWAEAAGEASNHGVVFAGELTGQVGDWEESVGENNKEALYAGLLRAQRPLPTDAPPPGEVVWADGSSQAVTLLSANDALRAVVAGATATCASCTPLEVTGANLGTATVQTSRGPATTPVWQFTLSGTSVKVTQIAVSNNVSVVPPAWDSNNPPAGLSIDSAVASSDGRHLTVSFTGAPEGADQPCGADYTAQAVESELAVVVIVVEHPNALPGACAGVGAIRTAVADLASPLADRAVLEVRQGLPVPVVTD